MSQEHWHVPLGSAIWGHLFISRCEKCTKYSCFYSYCLLLLRFSNGCCTAGLLWFNVQLYTKYVYSRETSCATCVSDLITYCLRQIGRGGHMGSAPLTLLAALILVPVLSKMSVSSVFRHLSWPTCAPTFSFLVNKMILQWIPNVCISAKSEQSSSHRLLISGRQHTPFPLLPDLHRSWLLQSALTLRILQTSVRESAWKCFLVVMPQPSFPTGTNKVIDSSPKVRIEQQWRRAHAGYETWYDREQDKTHNLI